MMVKWVVLGGVILRCALSMAMVTPGSSRMAGVGHATNPVMGAYDYNMWDHAFKS